MIISVGVDKYYHVRNSGHMIILKNNTRGGTRTKKYHVIEFDFVKLLDVNDYFFRHLIRILKLL